MRNGRRGIGIISVHKNACGSCYNVLPPQTVIEIRNAQKVITCHTCGIILFWENSKYYIYLLIEKNELKILYIVLS